MKLIITRHPLTIEMEKGIIQGKNAGAVSQKGFQQIKKFIGRIKKEKINFIISSDAKRCKTMANEILKEINVPFEFTGLIDEKSYGENTGKKASEIDKSLIQGNTLDSVKHPGGENLIEVRERAKKFLESLDKYKKTNKTILIISHSIFLSLFIGLILKMDTLDSRYKLKINNCSFSEIEINEKGKFIVKTLNENSFLD